MAARTASRDETNIADALHSATIHLLRGVRKEDLRTGLGPARLSALSVLVFAGPMRLSELARIEQVKPPTMTKVVAGLEAEGLVKRRVDATDARAAKLVATARGTKLLQQGRLYRVTRLSAALQALSPEELAVLRRAAGIIERVSKTI